MNLLPRRWPVLLVTLFLSATSLPAAEDANPGILFVRLRLQDGAFSFVSATNVPGVLKTPRGAKQPRAFQLVVEAAEGKPVWTEEIADPAVQRLEYADPAKPGVIQVKEVRRADVEFTVRLQAAPGNRILAIYRQTTPAAGATRKTTPARDLVTRIALPDLPPP